MFLRYLRFNFWWLALLRRCCCILFSFFWIALINWFFVFKSRFNLCWQSLSVRRFFLIVNWLSCLCLHLSLSTIIMFLKSSIFLCFFKTSGCAKSTSLGHQFLKIFFLLSFLMSSNCFIYSFYFQNRLNFRVWNIRFCSIRSKFTFISISFKPIIIWMFIFLFLDSWFQEKIFICVSSNSSLCST